MAQPTRVPLLEVLNVVPISPTQGAAVVWQVALRLERWLDKRAPATLVVPELEHLSIKRDGSLWWYRGRVVASQEVVPALGALLGALLQRASVGRTPPGLLYVLARSSDARHLAHFGSLAELRAALARHATGQPASVVDGLLARFSIQRAGYGPLGCDSTISDVRRLRRASGVSLTRIAEDTGIPISLLRELEWGVFSNWDLPISRPSLEAYSARAGLEPERVLAIVDREQQQRRQWSHVSVAATSGHQNLASLGLAAAMLAMILFGAPVDRAARPDVQSRHAAAPARPPEARPAILPVVDRRDAPGNTTLPAQRPRRPARTALSVRPLEPSPEPRRASRDGSMRRRETSPTIQRIARAITGDGRYKVEPFPRP